MDAKELRLGNLIYNHNEIDTILIISETSIEFGKTLMNNSPKNIKPIPLTDEWLLKFGFEKSDVVYKKGWFELWYSSYAGCFRLRIIKIGNDIEKVINIYHVHKLQNIYFLFMEEELTR